MNSLGNPFIFKLGAGGLNSQALMSAKPWGEGRQEGGGRWPTQKEYAVCEHRGVREKVHFSTQEYLRSEFKAHLTVYKVTKRAVQLYHLPTHSARKL